MAETAEVVIVGGGMVGCATAYLLARAGVRTTIIEKEAVGSCASGFAFGLLNPVDGHDAPGPLGPLALESFRMHSHLTEEVKAETGIDPQTRTLSCLWVVLDESETQEFQKIFQMAQGVEGFPTRWLDGQEVRSLEPRVSRQVIKALCMEGTMQVACHEYTLALTRAAKKYGATIRHSTVQGLRWANGRIVGVALAEEEVACEKVVLAMGPWTGQAASWLGMPVPIGPLKGQILRLELAGPPLGQIFYRSGGGYVSSKPDGLIWVGTTRERVGFDDRPTPEARESIMKDAMSILPVLSEARLVLQTACLRPVSEDELPIIGEVPGREGVYLATGAGRKGILLGPAMARAIADLVTVGHTNLPVRPFSPARFASSP